MIYKFKDTARVPHGVTASAVVAELDLIESEYGKRSPVLATQAVIEHPEQYPSLRAFGPESPEQAFRDQMRQGITYAVRCLVEDTDDSQPIRAYFLVTDEDNDQVWETIEIIAKESHYRDQLMAELRKDAQAFTSKLQRVLAEVARLVAES